MNATVSPLHTRIVAARKARLLTDAAPVVPYGKATLHTAHRRVTRMALGLAGMATLVGAALGVVGGAEMAHHGPQSGRTAVVVYTGSTDAQSDQYGPVRAPSDTELSEYSASLRTAHGPCGLEWHGTDGGWWETVCQVISNE